MYMSKQLLFEDWAPATWLTLAKGLYARMLREAAHIDNIKEAKRAPAADASVAVSKGPGLFRNHFSASLVVAEQAEAPPANDGGNDVVTDEMQRWKALEKHIIDAETDSDGVVNEFSLLYKLRLSFPLHYRVFRQVSSHLCHEANTEQLFSLSGSLSDDNGKMDPESLAIWTSVGSNMKIFKPPLAAILHRYITKYGKDNGVGDE